MLKGGHPRVCSSSPRKWTCHFCGKVGHIRPFCYKLHRYNRFSHRRLNDKSSKKVLLKSTSSLCKK